MPDTQSLPESVVHWNRPGNSRPADGYLLRLFPKPWFTNAPAATSIFTSLDNSLETGRFYIDVLKAAHIIRLAAGTDLDDLGALLGIPRLPGESDERYRVRIPATVLHGIAASTIPAMQNYLTAALGVPVAVVDVSPGIFMVTLLENSPIYLSASSLIAGVKAAGTHFTARMLVPVAPHVGGLNPLFGGFVFGTQPVGDTGVYIPI